MLNQCKENKNEQHCHHLIVELVKELVNLLLIVMIHGQTVFLLHFYALLIGIKRHRHRRLIPVAEPDVPLQGSGQHKDL